MDLEMTGLYPDRDSIIEIATLITNRDLEIIAEGPEYIIQQESARFELMDDWNKKQHTKSGLWEKVVASKTTIQEAEHNTVKFIKKHTVKGAILAGNSIWQDRRFIINEMPELDKYLHYRMIDVTAVKMLGSYWYDKEHFQKHNTHRALDDIKESINELKFYKETIFK